MGKTEPILQCQLLFTGHLQETQNLLQFSLFSISKDKTNTVVFTSPQHPSLDAFIGLPVLTQMALLWDSQNVYLDSINLVILHHFSSDFTSCRTYYHILLPDVIEPHSTTVCFVST